MGENAVIARLGNVPQARVVGLKVFDHSSNPFILQLVQRINNGFQSKLNASMPVFWKVAEDLEFRGPGSGDFFAGAVFENAVCFFLQPDLQLHFHTAIQAGGGVFKPVLGGGTQGVVEEFIEQGLLGIGAWLAAKTAKFGGVFDERQEAEVGLAVEEIGKGLGGRS